MDILDVTDYLLSIEKVLDAVLNDGDPMGMIPKEVKDVFIF